MSRIAIDVADQWLHVVRDKDTMHVVYVMQSTQPPHPGLRIFFFCTVTTQATNRTQDL